VLRLDRGATEAGLPQRFTLTPSIDGDPGAV
jgi:hypothetical protein